MEDIQHNAFTSWTLYSSNGIFCHIHYVDRTSLLRTSNFFHICSYILLVLSSILHRTSEMRLICFWTTKTTHGHQVFGLKALNYQNIDRKS
ncbi:hypothetical protein X975_10965, partial [Stegodyphus mimosarum]